MSCNEQVGFMIFFLLGIPAALWLSRKLPSSSPESLRKRLRIYPLVLLILVIFLYFNFRRSCGIIG